MTLCASCQPRCESECSSTQVCVLSTNNCQSCPPSVCIERKLAIHEYATMPVNEDNKTALIAGLVTSFVVLVLILFTFSMYVYFYKRRKRRKFNDTEKSIATCAKLQPIPETSINQWQTVDYNHPSSPFIIGAQSLQIPHLDSPDPILIRRSLNDIPQTTTSTNYLNRASSVRVTKYDHRPIPTTIHNDDDELKRNKPKRAVSIKKNNSMASSVTRVESMTDIKMAIPKVVRINTVTSKEGDVTRKRSFRTAIEPPPHVLNMQTTCSSSTIGDGEITVYWEPPP